MNVVRFPKRFRPPPAPPIDDPDIVHAKQQQRYAKWHQWKSEVRRYGGGHRKQVGDVTHYNTIATIEIDKVKWRELEYREAKAAEVLEALLRSGVIKVGSSRRGLYRFCKSGWGHMSDRMIRQCLNQHLTFTRDGIPVHPPRWLPEAMRFAAYKFVDHE